MSVINKMLRDLDKQQQQQNQVFSVGMIWIISKDVLNKSKKNVVGVS